MDFEKELFEGEDAEQTKKDRKQEKRKNTGA